ncbi:MAG: hypothetical protein HY316_08845 [Acidobacteria bacterium]|nr:hypothetical protein [Acidobacteriota bacterium]
MLQLKAVTLALAVLLTNLLVSCNQQAAPAPTDTAAKTDAKATPAGEMPDSPPPAAETVSDIEAMQAEHPHEAGTHQDHASKHGGTFFMALNNQHHLEGVLDRPGIIRIYLYDSYTRPLSREELGRVPAKVIWGNRDGAPEIDLKPNADGTALEANAPEAVQFPFTLTLLCWFPGTSPTSRPELFTFPFSHYSHIDTTPHTH